MAVLSVQPNFLTFSDDTTVHDSFIKHEARFATFYNWSQYDVQQPFSLAAAGFFCRDARAGLVECYHCGLQLNHWKATDSPMVEHIRHRSTCGYLVFKFGQIAIDRYGKEFDVELDKEADFLNIEGRPTFNQYLSWMNYMKRLGVTFRKHDPTDFVKWRKAKKIDVKIKVSILYPGFDTVEKRLKSLLHVSCYPPYHSSILQLAQEGLMYDSTEPEYVHCAYCGKRSSIDRQDKDYLSHHVDCPFVDARLSIE